MNDKFTEAIDRAKSYVSKLAEEENNLPSNIDLNKIWQLNSRYIVSPIESAIVIIDQSLAHQRILYDGAIKSFNSSSFSSQTLLFPKKLKFESENFSDLLDALPYLNRIGFNMKKHDKNSVIIESIPSEMLWGNEIKIVNQMLEDFKLMINKELSKEEAIALSFSNRACIKNGDSLSNSEMVELVNRLFGTKKPFICPNGNVILIQISLNEIENKFNRK